MSRCTKIVLETFSGGRETPRYSQNRAKNYDLRQNRLLGFNVSRYTDTVLENVHGRSKNPKGQLKPSYRLWFATNSSPGQQRVKVHRNSPRKRAPQVEKPPGTVPTELQTMVCNKMVSWASTFGETLKQSSKTCTTGRKTPRYSKTEL